LTVPPRKPRTRKDRKKERDLSGGASWATGKEKKREKTRAQKKKGNPGRGGLSDCGVLNTLGTGGESALTYPHLWV